jgi:hypothetical protein
MTILKDHQAGWLDTIVLSGDVEVVFAGCFREDLAGPFVFGDLADGNVRVSLGIVSKHVGSIRIGRSSLVLGAGKLGEQAAEKQGQQEFCADRTDTSHEMKSRWLKTET